MKSLIFLFAVLCLFFVFSEAREVSLLQHEITPENPLEELSLEHAECKKISNLEYSCAVDWEGDILEHRIEFHGNVSLTLNPQDRTVTFAVDINGHHFEKTVGLKDLTLPICIPIVGIWKISLKACLLFSQLEIEQDPFCLKGDWSVALKVLIKSITLFGPNPFALGHCS